MHKYFYASGFLYHIPTQQILLQQYSSNPFWNMFEGQNKGSEKEVDTFQRVIYSVFGEKPSTASIHSIYDYIDNDSGVKRFILYTQVRNIKKYVSRKKEYKLSWFNFKEIGKLKLTEQTRQDIIVGQRVVLLAARSKELAEVES